MENNLRRALSISGGDIAVLFESPIALTIYVTTILMLAFRMARKGAQVIARARNHGRRRPAVLGATVSAGCGHPLPETRDQNHGV